MATASDALAWERSQIGHVGGGKYWQMMGYGYTDYNAPAWCMCFQCCCFKANGIDVPGLPWYGCSSWYNYLRSNHPEMLVSDPKPGDLVLYDWGVDSDPCDHVGMVVSATSTIVTSYEGNTTGNSVAVRNRSRSSVRAFVRIPYETEDEMTEADFARIQKMLDEQNKKVGWLVWSYKYKPVNGDKDAYALLTEVPVRVWGYRNKEYESVDAYRILRDVRNALFPNAAKKLDGYEAKGGVLAKVCAALGIKL